MSGFPDSLSMSLGGDPAAPASRGDQYARQLKQLLPPGPLWRLDPGSWISNLLRGVAEELARVDDRGENLLDEWDPRTALELLPEWERVLGLPEDGGVISGVASERQLAVTAKYLAQGGQTAAYFIGLAARLGFVATVEEPGAAGTPITFVAAGALSYDGAPGLPVGLAANDILVAVVAGAPAAPSGWTLLASSSTYLGVYWRRATASETVPAFGAGYRSQMAAYRGAVASGSPFEATGAAGSSGASGVTGAGAGAAAPSIVTLTDGAMVLLAHGEHVGPGNNGPTITYTDPADGQPARARAFAAGDSPAGNTAIGLGLWHGVRVNAGATGVASGAHVSIYGSAMTYASAAVLLAMRPAATTIPAHTWRLNVNLAASPASYTLSATDFRAGAARAGDRVRNLSVGVLESLINRLKPAHTVCLFNYT